MSTLPPDGDREAALLRVLHISDTHLLGDGSRHLGVVDTLAALDRVLAAAEAVGALDLVVCSGDLSDDGSVASYRALRERVDAFAQRHGAEVVSAMGNHDVRAGFEAVLGERSRVLEVRGVRVIVLDSSVPGFGSGRLARDQLDLLAAALAVPAPNGAIVVLHHPPVPARTPLLAALELRDPEQLLRRCAAGAVPLVLAGHYHHALVETRGGVTVAVAPGVANRTDLLALPGHERAVAGSGFAVVEYRSGSAGVSVAVTAVPVPGPDDGRELFDLGPDEVRRIAQSAAEPAQR